MRQRRNLASSPASVPPTSPPYVTAARCCSKTAANCGWPASKLPTTAARRCRALAAGQTLRLERLGAERDRYGRVVAFAFAGDATQSVQQALLEPGPARVSARVGDKACADGAFGAERAARAAGRGLWADPNFAPLPAENLARLRAERGHFALVEGKVLSVRESGATIYVNFGRRWTRDFTVIILRRHQRQLSPPPA